jgi:hypothetical protein
LACKSDYRTSRLAVIEVVIYAQSQKVENQINYKKNWEQYNQTDFTLFVQFLPVCFVQDSDENVYMK